MGFSFLELLIVVSTISVLSAIAIPQFFQYKDKAFDARASSDLRNFMTAQEAHYTSSSSYTIDFDDLDEVEISEGVVLEITEAQTSGPDIYDWVKMRAYHPAGNHTYCYDGQNDGKQIFEINGVDQPCPSAT